MRSVILMCKPARLWVVSGSLLFSLAGLSQVNSPYSRYGIGDLYGSRNAVSRGMGGLATAYRDIQSVNFVNPASYSNIGFVTFDVGVEPNFVHSTIKQRLSGLNHPTSFLIMRHWVFRL